VLKLMERRAKLTGLDAPEKVQEVGPVSDAKASLLAKWNKMAVNLGPSGHARLQTALESGINDWPEWEPKHLRIFLDLTPRSDNHPYDRISRVVKSHNQALGSASSSQADEQLSVILREYSNGAFSVTDYTRCVNSAVEICQDTRPPVASMVLPLPLFWLLMTMVRIIIPCSHVHSSRDLAAQRRQLSVEQIDVLRPARIAGSIAVPGVTRRFVQNCTLSWEPRHRRRGRDRPASL
jgi:hypothetical protein